MGPGEQTKRMRSSRGAGARIPWQRTMVLLCLLGSSSEAVSWKGSSAQGPSGIDGALSPHVAAFVQDPARPGDDPVPSAAPEELSQVEGFQVFFRLTVENRGTAILAPGSAHLAIDDSFECPRPPVGAVDNTCGTRRVGNWSNEAQINVGGNASVSFRYWAPEFLCFDRDACCQETPPPNVHTLRAVLTVDADSDLTNNEVGLVVEVLPALVLCAPRPDGTGLAGMMTGLALVVVGAFAVAWRVTRVTRSR